MANTNNSPNMALPIPSVGNDPGPQYAQDVNNCLTLVDGHNHSPGYGVQITPTGLNIDADLTIQGNNLLQARTLRLAPQVSTPAGAADLGCLYEVGVDLYYTDGNGNVIRITQAGGITGASGSIANLTSPASATYVSGDQTFVWQSNVNTPANLDAASIILRNLTANSNGVTLSAPPALSSNTTITLPSLPAISQAFMLMDTSGNLNTNTNVDSNTLVIGGGSLHVASGGINTTQLADGAVTQPKLAVRGAQTPASGGQVAVSASSGAFTSTSNTLQLITNLSVQIETFGSPVMIMLVPFPNTVGTIVLDGTASCEAQFNLQGGSATYNVSVGSTNVGVSSTSLLIPPGAVAFLDTPTAGIYTYTLRGVLIGGTSYSVVNCRLIAYEL